MDNVYILYFSHYCNHPKSTNTSSKNKENIFKVKTVTESFLKIFFKKYNTKQPVKCITRTVCRPHSSTTLLV